MGDPIDHERVGAALADATAPVRAVFATRCETSTGVVNDVRALSEVARRHGTVLCVDAVSGLGAVDLPQDEWGVDVVVAGSQKSCALPGWLSCRPPARSPGRPSGRAAATTSIGS